MSNKKILILGASGMAGHVLFYYLKENSHYEIVTICHRDKIEPNSYILDVYDTNQLQEIIVKEQPDVIVNCIGVLVKGSKSNPQNAIFINAYFPHKLSDITHSIVPTPQVIHISTDCVFSGQKGNYKDTDIKDALDVYGMSKNLGELINDKDLTIRTSIIGPEIKSNGEGLFHWFLMNRKSDSVNGFSKSIWGGITTLQLAKCIHYFIENKFVGLYQISNEDAISKYDLLKLIKNEFELSLTLNEVEGLVCDKSILSTKIDGKILINIPSYKKMIEEMKIEMDNHKELYTQYYK